MPHSVGDRWLLKLVLFLESLNLGITKEREIEDLIEVKYSEFDISKHLQYYSEKLVPKRSLQIVAKIKKSYSKGKICVVNPFESLIESPWGKS